MHGKWAHFAFSLCLYNSAVRDIVVSYDHLNSRNFIEKVKATKTNEWALQGNEMYDGLSTNRLISMWRGSKLKLRQVTPIRTHTHHVYDFKYTQITHYPRHFNLFIMMVLLLLKWCCCCCCLKKTKTTFMYARGVCCVSVSLSLRHKFNGKNILLNGRQFSIKF